MTAPSRSEGLSSRRAIILVSGIPGAGKSTVANLLARRFDRGVHVDADIVRAMIVSGNAWSPEGPATNPLATPGLEEEAQRQLRLRAHTTSLLADAYLAVGFTVVLDEIAVGERLEDFRYEIKGRPRYLVTLTPSLDVVRERIRSRPGHDVFEIWKHLDGVMRETTPRAGLWLDSSEQTPEETVDEIVARVWSEGELP